MSEATATSIAYLDKQAPINEEQSASQLQFETRRQAEPTGISVDRVFVLHHLQSLLSKLNEVFISAKGLGWDGENAEPISDATFYNATKLLSVLPKSVPSPEIFPDNDGYIEFEWCKDRRTFSLYVTDTNLVLYAGFYGKKERLSGRFDYEGFFPELMEFLAKDVYKEGAQ